MIHHFQIHIVITPLPLDPFQLSSTPSIIVSIIPYNKPMTAIKPAATATAPTNPFLAAAPSASPLSSGPGYAVTFDSPPPEVDGSKSTIPSPGVEMGRMERMPSVVVGTSLAEIGRMVTDPSTAPLEVGAAPGRSGSLETGRMEKICSASSVGIGARPTRVWGRRPTRVPRKGVRRLITRKMEKMYYRAVRQQPGR